MARIKDEFRERLDEGKEISKEGIDAGYKLEGDGEAIKSIMDSLDDLDDDDIELINVTKEKYQDNFNEAFKSEVSDKIADLESHEEELMNEADIEVEKVTEAGRKVAETASINDIVSESASEAEGKLTESGEEYKEVHDQADETLKEAKERAEDLGDSIGSMF